MSEEGHPYRVYESHRLTPRVTQFILQPESHALLAHQAGQYIKVIHKDGYESPLSIACSPDATRRIELHVSHPEKNPRAQEILRMANDENALLLSGPFGKCTYSRLNPDLPILFYARGTGFAPIKAILEESLPLQKVKSHFFWGVADVNDLYLQEMIKQWIQTYPHFRYTSVVCRTVDQHRLCDAVLQQYPDLSQFQVYASGPKEMVLSASHDLGHHGLKQERLFSDVLDML